VAIMIQRNKWSHIAKRFDSRILVTAQECNDGLPSLAECRQEVPSHAFAIDDHALDLDGGRSSLKERHQ